MWFTIKNLASYYSNLLISAPKNRKKIQAQFLQDVKMFSTIAKGGIKQNHWLVVKLDDIGDFLLFVDAFNSFVIAAPKTITFTVLINEVCETLARKLIVKSNINFITVNKQQWFNNAQYRLQLAQKIVNECFEKVLFPSLTRMPLLEGLIQQLFEPTQIIAYKRQAEPGESEKLITKLNQAQQLFEPTQQMHELTLNQAFFGKVLQKDLTLKNSLQQADLPNYIAANKPYYVLCTGGNQKSKHYPPKQYAKLVQYIANHKPEITVVAVGSMQDKAQAAIALQGINNAINLCGKTNLLEVLAICKHAEFFIGNDNSVAHMAALQNVKTLVLANGNRFGRFFPYPNGFNVKVVYPKAFLQLAKHYNWPHKTAIAAIMPGEVIKQLTFFALTD